MHLTKAQERSLDVRRAHGYGPIQMPSERDRAIQELMRAASGPGFLAETLRVIHPRSSDILSAFAKRMATLAVGTINASIARDGLAAVQLTRANTRDFREAVPARTLLYRAFAIIVANPDSEFRKAHQALPVPMKETLVKFADREPRDRSVQAMLYHEESKGGSFRFVCDW
ncbi:hypothetical protein [Kitasatospora sp. NPDC091207]|uniref:hypothetical protein n=1 Tax=Kitasatospora sp. NPDC091207 TaxID=3364083 RepID=UPI0037F3F758